MEKYLNPENWALKTEKEAQKAASNQNIFYKAKVVFQTTDNPEGEEKVGWVCDSCNGQIFIPYNEAKVQTGEYWLDSIMPI